MQWVISGFGINWTQVLIHTVVDQYENIIDVQSEIIYIKMNVYYPKII